MVFDEMPPSAWELIRVRRCFSVSLIWGLFYFSRGLCKELVKGWSSLDSSCFSIEMVSGGITNLCLSPHIAYSETSFALRENVLIANGGDIRLCPVKDHSGLSRNYTEQF